jgi:hypothetical protein
MTLGVSSMAGLFPAASYQAKIILQNVLHHTWLVRDGLAWLLQCGGCSVSGVPALWLVQLPRCPRGLGAGGGRLHRPLLGGRPGARGVLRLREAGAPVLRIHTSSHLQVPQKLRACCQPFAPSAAHAAAVHGVEQWVEQWLYSPRQDVREGLQESAL